MPFQSPNLNLRCNIYTPDRAGVATVPVNPPRGVNIPCALVYGRRVNVASSGGTALPGVPIAAMSLLVAAHTDIRGPQDVSSFDIVEVPAGSGRWYWCAAVDDISKGYPTEHRYALLFAIAGSWNPPYA